MKSAVPVAIANEANGAIGKITGFISLLLYCSGTRKHTREWSYFYLQVLSDSLLHGDCHIATFWWWFSTVWQCNKTCVPWLLCLGVVLYLTSVSLWSSIPLPTVSLKIHLQLSLSKKNWKPKPLSILLYHLLLLPVTEIAQNSAGNCSVNHSTYRSPLTRGAYASVVIEHLVHPKHCKLMWLQGVRPQRIRHLHVCRCLRKSEGADGSLAGGWL